MRNQNLRKALNDASLVDVWVGDKNFQWLEASFAVEIPLEQARALGQQFQQNAIYWVQNDQLFLVSCLADARLTDLGALSSRCVHRSKLFQAPQGEIMKDITPDICDHFAGQVRLLSLPLQSYGKRTTFWGEIVTVRCYHDNSKVKQVLDQDGRGKVLIVDGNGSTQKALLGDMLAQKAVDNGWQGIIVHGAIRDAAQLAEMDLGVLALATNPFKTEKRDQGEVNVTLTIQNQQVQPNDHVYADQNGVLISSHPLDLASIGLEMPLN